MPETTNPTSKVRPGQMHLTNALQYRMPLAALVSILHRASGALIFVLLPFVIWMFDGSVSTESSYERFANAFVAGIGVVPAVLVKLVVLALIWAYLHHALAGLRHMWMDVTHRMSKDQGRHTAAATLVISLALTVGLAGKLFGLY
ncbi:MAG: succinate dehydrogenase, cytochrome b556 subunit [Burkholderiales bacterium]|nr:succinate dehydrogenase, cytochrome b556 subunit [Burkholderiales bacterium]